MYFIRIIFQSPGIPLPQQRGEIEMKPKGLSGVSWT